MKAYEQIRDWTHREGRKLSWLAAQVPMNASHLTQCLKGNHVPIEMTRNRLAAITGLDVAAEEAWRNE